MAMSKNIKKARDWFFVTYLTFLFALLGLFQVHYDRLPDGQLYVGREFIELYIATAWATVIFWVILEYVLGVEGPFKLIAKARRPAQPVPSEDLSIPQAR